MKSRIQPTIIQIALHSLKTLRLPAASATPNRVERKGKSNVKLAPATTNQILYSLMIPTVMMVLAGSMAGVALPTIRTDFQIPADMVAWVTTIYTLPFMILMPLYGRLSDGLGKRRLILAGIIIFSIGSAIILMAPSLAWLMAGRAIQGIGTAGLMPLGMAMISAIFPAAERGKALGSWSATGPMVGFLSPLAAGFLIDHWGWRAAFVPSLIMGFIAFIAIFKYVPAGLSQVKPHFLRTFDWNGVILLVAAATGFLFYLSSRPITGVASLRDWRLLAATIVLTGGFIWWERQRQNPFVNLQIFKNRVFTLASFSSGVRMFLMSGIGFLVPLYLVDVYQVSAAYVGGMMMIMPGTMILTVRFGGQIADKWGSRWPSVIGLAAQALGMAMFAWIPANASLWFAALVLGFYGLGAGLVLAALHQAAVANMSEEEVGPAAGLYSMIRFSGSAVGSALGGVILQQYLSRSLTPIEAYQIVFLCFAGAALLGVAAAFGLYGAKAKN